MDKSTPIHELIGKSDEEESNSLVDDILQELHKQPPAQPIMSHPAPSPMGGDGPFAPLASERKPEPENKKPEDKTYETFVWCVEHLKVPVLVFIFYLLFQNRSFVSQFHPLLPLSIQDPYSFGNLCIHATLIAVTVEFSRSMWD